MGTRTATIMATTIMAITIRAITAMEVIGTTMEATKGITKIDMEMEMVTTMDRVAIITLPGRIPVRWNVSSVRMGHYANECPEKKADDANKPNPFQKGHVNHINVDEIQEESDAVIGKFKINTFPALILFDIGASHSFLSRAFVDRNNLPTRTIDRPIKISSPGGELIANHGCRLLDLQIGKHNFPTSLIVLES